MSITKHITNRNPNLYPFSWVLLKEKIVPIYQTSLKTLCTQFCHSPSSPWKVTVSQTLPSPEIFPGNPAWEALVMTLSPLPPCPIVCLFVSSYGFLGADCFHSSSPLALLRYCFIKESGDPVLPAKKKKKSLFLEGKRARKDLKKRKRSSFVPFIHKCVFKMYFCM